MVAETVIRGRAAEEGGPYRAFRCPACGAQNGVLANAAGRWMLYPLGGLEPSSLLDALLSVAERRRLERQRAWWRRHRERVETFRREGASPRVADAPGRGRAAVGSSRRPPPGRARRTPATIGPRSVLGVPADATLDEVRRAFRRLAKRHHPDRARGDPVAAERFREVRGAYEALLRELGG